MLDYTEKKQLESNLNQVSFFFYFFLSKSYFRILRLNLKKFTKKFADNIDFKKKKIGFLSYILLLRNTGYREAETQQKW